MYACVLFSSQARCYFFCACICVCTCMNLILQQGRSHPWYVCMLMDKHICMSTNIKFVYTLADTLKTAVRIYLLYVYVILCVCVCMRVHQETCVFACLCCMHADVYTCLCMSVCLVWTQGKGYSWIPTCLCMFIHVCVFVCIDCAYVCMCLHVCAFMQYVSICMWMCECVYLRMYVYIGKPAC